MFCGKMKESSTRGSDRRCLPCLRATLSLDPAEQAVYLRQLRLQGRYGHQTVIRRENFISIHLNRQAETGIDWTYRFNICLILTCQHHTSYPASIHTNMPQSQNSTYSAKTFNSLMFPPSLLLTRGASSMCSIAAQTRRCYRTRSRYRSWQ